MSVTSDCRIVTKGRIIFTGRGGCGCFLANIVDDYTGYFNYDKKEGLGKQWNCMYCLDNIETCGSLYIL